LRVLKRAALLRRIHCCSSTRTTESVFCTERRSADANRTSIIRETLAPLSFSLLSHLSASIAVRHLETLILQLDDLHSNYRQSRTVLRDPPSTSATCSISSMPRSKAPSSTSSTRAINPCVVCGANAEFKCTECAKHGFDLYFCGIAHRKLVCLCIYSPGRYLTYTICYRSTSVTRGLAESMLIPSVSRVYRHSNSTSSPLACQTKTPKAIIRTLRSTPVAAKVMDRTRLAFRSRM
jgi:hypothetical protein